MEQSIAEEKWVVPHSYVDLAEIAIKEKQLDVAEELLKKGNLSLLPPHKAQQPDTLMTLSSSPIGTAKSYSNYDFDRAVGFLVVRGNELVKLLRQQAK